MDNLVYLPTTKFPLKIFFFITSYQEIITTQVVTFACQNPYVPRHVVIDLIHVSNTCMLGITAHLNLTGDMRYIITISLTYESKGPSYKPSCDRNKH